MLRAMSKRARRGRQGARAPDLSDRRVLAVAAACLVLSGAGSLVLEVTWSRLLRLVLGSSMPAVVTVLVAYMLGLGLGAFLASRLGSRGGDRLRLYGWLEIGIGLYALLVPSLVVAISAAERAFVYSLPAPFSTLVTFLLALAALALPTIAMGATLPVLVGAMMRARSEPGGTIAALYGANTTGAVVGALLPTALLLPGLGLLWTNAAGALLDIFAGTAALVLSRAAWWRASTSGAQRLETPAGPPLARPAPDRLQSPAPPDPVTAWILPSYVIVGAVSLVLQVSWTRSLVLVLGSSIYAFSCMLATFLAGIAIGSLALRHRIDRWPDPAAWYAAGLAAVGVLAGGTLFVLPRLPDLFLALVYWTGGVTPSSVVAIQFLMATVTMLPTTIVLGALFPLVSRILADAGRAADVALGRVYLTSSLGSATGALLAGFVLIPQLGVARTIAGASALVLLCSAALAWRRRAQAPRMAFAAIAGVAVLLPPLLLASSAQLAAMTLGVYRNPASYLRHGIELLPLEGIPGERIAFLRDGVHATVSVHEGAGQLSLRVDGKADASTGIDMPTQILLGQVPLLFGPAARDVAVVGFASGITVGSAATHPVARIDAIELEPAMLEASRWFTLESGDPLSDARVRVILEDARAHLSYTDQRYDVIISEPSNPWITGVSNLFTREFFAATRRALRPGGRLLQWVQLYSLDEATFGSIVGALRAEFPYLYGFRPTEVSTDLLILALDRPLTADDFPRWEDLPEAARTDLQRIGFETSPQLWSLLRLAPEDLERAALEAPVVNDDDNLFVELHSPRLLYEDRSDQLQLAIAQAPPAAIRVYEAGGSRLDPDDLAELALAWAERDPVAGAAAVETARARGVYGPLTAAEWLLADEESRPARLQRLDESIGAGSATESALRVRAWLRADEDPAAALADVERFLERRPWSGSGLRLRARLLMDLGRHEDAEQDLAALEAFDPANRDTDLLAIRARTRESAGDPRGAAWALARTLEVYPEVESIQHLAALYRQAGDDGAEAVALRDADRAQRNTVLRLHRAARHRLWEGHQDAARELLDLLVQLDPDYEPARRELAELR